MTRGLAMPELPSPACASYREGRRWYHYIPHDTLRAPHMTLTEAQVKELIAALRGDNESARLKACDALAKVTPADRNSALAAVPTLTQVFLDDGNPAVKFLAKKALTNLGEDPDKMRLVADAALGG